MTAADTSSPTTAPTPSAADPATADETGSSNNNDNTDNGNADTNTDNADTDTGIAEETGSNNNDTVDADLSAGGTAADDTTADDTTTDDTTTDDTTAGDTTGNDGSGADTAADGTSGGPVSSPEVNPAPCEEIAAQFSTRGAVNDFLAEPISSAVCDGEMVVVTSNGIPDYTYIRTSPGDPNPQNHITTFAAAPVFADTTTEVPLLGELGVAVNGVPIYGPTEGTGGDVLSLQGALSECGSHNGPTGFHMHLLGTSSSTDCLFSPEEVAAGPQLVGYALDGFPILSGNDQYTSSWELTDPSLFATDTWAAHSYVEGSGDLDECNGRTAADGTYAYYTTDTFPYVLGCFQGAVELGRAGGPGEGGPGEGGPGEGGPGEGGPPQGGTAEQGTGQQETGQQGTGQQETGQQGTGQQETGQQETGATQGTGTAQGGAPAGGPDLTEAAAALGVSVEELERALGPPPPDLDAAAAALGVTPEELQAVLPAPGR